MPMAETGENQAVVPHNLGDLMNVASIAPSANLSILVWRVSTSDWGPLAPHAAIVDIATADAATQSSSYVQADAQTVATLATATKAKVNAILAALRSNGIVAP